MYESEKLIFEKLLSSFQILYTDHKFLRRSVTYANPSIDKRLWITSRKHFEYISKTSWKGVNKNSLTWWYVLQTSWRRLKDVLKTFSRRLEDVLKTSWRRFENVLRTSWRRLEDLLKTYGQDEYIGLDQDVLKTSWWRLLKTYE